MSKRPNGDGSIHRSTEGGWRAAVSYTDPATGKVKRRTRRARRKSEAVDHLRAMQRELEDYGRPADQTRTVGETVEDYLRVRDAHQLELGARVNDRWAMRIVTDGLGEMPVNSLTVTDCDDFLRSAALGRYSGLLGRDQLKRLRGRLIKAIENDRRRGLVLRNVAELSVLPSVSPNLVERRPARVIAVPELRSLLEEAAGAIGVLIDLSGRHGLRPAEARGLRWKSVDLDARTVTVEGQINRRNQITKAKTKRAYRTIRVDDETVERFLSWRTEQDQDRSKAGPVWLGNADGLVATTARGTAINQRNVHRSLAQLSQRLGISPAVAGYDLRHTAITYQVEKDYPVHRIADWAGTSERMIWDVYRHRMRKVAELSPSDDIDGWHQTGSR